MKTYKVTESICTLFATYLQKQFTDLIRKIHRLPRLVVKGWSTKAYSLLYTKIKKIDGIEILNRMVEYLDNRISRYSMKSGKCEITKQFCQQKPFTVITIYQKSWWRRQI